MSAIITATDFSDIANNAVHYACDLAGAFDTHLILLHSYSIPVAFNDNPMPVISIEESKKIADEQLEGLMDELVKKYPQLVIKKELGYGDITDSLKDAIKKHQASMVVVGNSTSEDSGFWLGSNLLSTLRNLSCPVLAIPAHYQYKKVDNIAFACDFEHVTDQLPAADLNDIVARTGGKLHVLNVDHENRHFDPDTPFEFVHLDNALKPSGPQYHNIDSADIEVGIEQFAGKNNIDWLVVVPHKHNFFESLFHKSQTKALVRNAKIPILALHDIVKH